MFKKLAKFSLVFMIIFGVSGINAPLDQCDFDDIPIEDLDNN